MRPGQAVLLALKSELWQSRPVVVKSVDYVLLASKSELWQSEVWNDINARGVLLASKSELWQSVESSPRLIVAFCSHQNLNYGKAVGGFGYLSWSFARIKI